MEIECDTLILSVGLIPYISLLDYIDCPTSSTKGAKVNEHMETMIEVSSPLVTVYMFMTSSIL